MKTPDLGALGITGVAGIGLLLFCLSFYFGSLAPAQTELAKLKREETRLLAAGAPDSAGSAGGGGPGKPVSALTLPRVTDTPAISKKLIAAAQEHGVIIDHASYRLLDKDGPLRLEASLPLKGSYPSLRAYLREALGLASMSSLDELKMKRSQSSEPMVEADIRLSYALAPPP